MGKSLNGEAGGASVPASRLFSEKGAAREDARPTNSWFMR